MTQDILSKGLRSGMMMQPKMQPKMKQPGYMHGGKVTMPDGYKAGGKIGDVAKDDGTDKVEVMARQGEYFLNPETVAHLGGGDYEQGVRGLNQLVREATGKEPGPTPAGKGGKQGFAWSGPVVDDFGNALPGREIPVTDNQGNLQQTSRTGQIMEARAARTAANAVPPQGKIYVTPQGQAMADPNVSTYVKAATPPAPTNAYTSLGSADAGKTMLRGAARAKDLALRTMPGPNALKYGTATLGGVGTAAGLALDAADVYDVATDPNMSGVDTATEVASKAGKWGAAGLGALKGGAFGAGIGGPFAPATGLLGAITGGALGYFVGDKLIEGGRALTGVETRDPSEYSNGAINSERAKIAAEQAGAPGQARLPGQPAAPAFNPAKPLAYDDSKDFPEFKTGTAPIEPGAQENLRKYLGGTAGPNGKLPQDLSSLQAGTVYKTKDNNGRTVYSGMNVGTGANIVDERGLRTGNLQGNDVMAGGAPVSLSPYGFAGTPSSAAGAATQGQGLRQPASAAGATAGAPAAMAPQPSQGTSDALSSALRAAADRGDWGAVQNYYQGQQGGTGKWMGRTEEQDRDIASRRQADGLRDFAMNQLRFSDISAYDDPKRAAMKRANAAAARETLKSLNEGAQVQAQSDQAKATAARAQSKDGLSAKDMLELMFKQREYERSVGKDKFEQAGQNAERDRARRADITKSLQQQFQTPEMKDGKPTGRMVDDAVGMGRFMEEVSAKIGKEKAEGLTGEEWQGFARDYKPAMEGIDRFNADQKIVDPGLRQLASRSAEWGDVLKPGKVGVLDVANAKLNPFGSKLSERVAIDPVTGQRRRADEVYMRNGVLDVRMLRELDPALAKELGLGGK